MTKTVNLFIASLICFYLAASVWSADFSPWNPLTSDSWVILDATAWLDPNNRLEINTINPDQTVYYIGFDKVKKDGGARGMNSLKFGLGTQDTGHMLSEDQIGSFFVKNTGDSRTFADILLFFSHKRLISLYGFILLKVLQFPPEQGINFSIKSIMPLIMNSTFSVSRTAA